jgi:acetyl-CoA C-acetyltransferase
MAVGVEKLKDSNMQGLVVPGAPTDGTTADMTAPAMFSLLVPAYMAKYGVSRDEIRHVMSHIASKNHGNGALNPRAHFQRAVSVDTITQAPKIAGDLNVFDCSGISDGSAAAIICRAEDAHKYTDSPLYIRALALSAGSDTGASDPNYDYTTPRTPMRKQG